MLIAELSDWAENRRRAGLDQQPLIDAIRHLRELLKRLS